MKTLYSFILKNKGATLDRDLKPVTYDSGYQVSYRDITIIKLKEFNSILLEQILDDISTAFKPDFIGLWIDDGHVYIDLSVRFLDLEDALAFAKAHEQKAIWSWADSESIYLSR